MQKIAKTKKPAVGRHQPRGVAALTIVAAAALLAACGGGGGGGGASGPEAVVQSVVATPMLERNGGVQSLLLTVTLDKPLLAEASFTYSTASLAKAGITGAPAGFATGGGACGGGVDYLQATSASPGRVTIPAGGSPVVTVSLPIVCGDTDFEPNEVFQLNWTVAARTGSLAVTLVNDDAGGLNSPGVATVLGGSAAFGRDTNPLTNAAIDGALGFSYKTTNGCREDLVTGLTWGPVGLVPTTYAAAVAEVAIANAAAQCGYTDWRVPGPEELASLVDHSRSVVPINADVESAATQMAGSYWSSARNAASILDQMVVGFSDTGAVSVIKQTATAGVRLVRGAPMGDPCDGSARFVNHGDGTLSDLKTGLMWKQCPEGLSGTACGTGTAFGTTRSGNLDAVERVAAVNAAPDTQGLGYADWRIPSRHELASLVCRGPATAPLTNTTVFPATGNFSYLSSTPHVGGLGATWFVNFDTDGNVAVTSDAGRRLRLVRAGQ